MFPGFFEGAVDLDVAFLLTDLIGVSREGPGSSGTVSDRTSYNQDAIVSSRVIRHMQTNLQLRFQLFSCSDLSRLES